jgi:hypothetical protein
MMMLDEIGLRRFARRFRAVSGSAYPGGERGLSRIRNSTSGAKRGGDCRLRLSLAVGEAFRRAHKFTRTNDFSGLSALLRNFCEHGFRPLAHSQGARQSKAAASFCIGPEPNRKTQRQRKCRFAKRNERFRKAGISHWNPYERRIAHFAGLFVFKGLAAFSFRRLLANLPALRPHSNRPIFDVSAHKVAQAATKDHMQCVVSRGVGAPFA